MSKIEKQLSKRIKVLREQYEYSQEELAELLKITFYTSPKRFSGYVI